MSLKTKSPDFSGQVLYVGIDTHKSNWKVSIRTKDIHLKTFSMNPSPEELTNHMKRHYPNGIYNSRLGAGSHSNVRAELAPTRCREGALDYLSS